MSIIRFAARRRFTVVSNDAVEDGRLSLRARGLIVWLLSKPDGWTVNSEMIATMVPEGRDAVRSALNELEAAGYLVREKIHNGKGHWVGVSTIYEAPGPGNPTSVNPASVNPASENQALITKDLEVITEKKTHACDEGFPEFWAGYPRKIGKPSALRAWKKVTADERLLVMVALSVRVKFWKDSKTEVQFIPYPATWLNDRRWEDELADPLYTAIDGHQGYHWSERRQIWIADGMG